MNGRNTRSSLITLVALTAFLAGVAFPPHVAAALQDRASAPAGTLMVIRLMDTIGSDRNKPGDPIRAELAEPMIANGRTVFPEGTEVLGTIKKVESPGRGQSNGSIEFVFNQIRTRDGKVVPIVANLEGASSYTQDSWKKRLFTLAVAAGGGALVSKIFGGSFTRGLLIGAAAGTGYMLYSEGEDVVLNAGTTVNMVLEENISVVYDFPTTGKTEEPRQQPAADVTQTGPGTFEAGTIASGPNVSLLLKSGKKETGQFRGITADGKVQLGLTYGQFSIPFADVREMVFDEKVTGKIESRSDDAFLLKNGNILNGYFLGLSNGRFVISTTYGELNVPFGDVARIVFGN